MNTHDFNQRLGETISWCLSQKIVCEPHEDEHIVHRRELNREGTELISKAYKMLAPYEHASRISRWIARRAIRRAAEIRRQGEQLMATANVGSIVPPLRHQLRSEALRDLAESLARVGTDHAAIVERVADRRSQLLRSSGTHLDSPVPGLHGGRLLVFAPEDNLACGAAEYASMGFFDVDNVPPWDTWIAMFGKYLVSWVPSQIVPLVQEGLDVNPEQCILWSDDPSLSRESVGAVLREFSSQAA
jgi:hypothetical protein